MKKTVAIILAMLCAVCCGLAASAQTGEQGEAVNIVKKCSFYSKWHYGEEAILYDRATNLSYQVYGEGEQYLQVNLNNYAAKGIYIKWDSYVPAPWTLEATLVDGSVVRTECGRYRFIQEYVELPDNTVEFRMITSDGEKNRLRIMELEVYTPGQLPGSVHVWEPTPSTAEIMFIATHQDDEILFFGGAIPYYAGELDLDSVIVYTAYDNNVRLHEALDGLWVCGQYQYPVFLYNKDEYCSSIDQARNFWNEDNVIAELTELIVRHRPQVVITQDENGEYGHGQHILTVYCVKQALEKAADTDYVARISLDYRPWSVSKCYLHLYTQNNVKMPWDTMKMESAGGKSAFQVACEAFKCHSSQQMYGYVVTTEIKEYDCSSFGLYWTQVGFDTGAKDFFENVTLRYEHVQPPESEVPDYLARIGSTGWLYRRTDGQWEVSEYLRYARVDGIDGWYAADSTGSLLEPAVRVIPVKDDLSLELTVYETLAQISSEPPLYSYSDGEEISELVVRYCSVGTGQTAFYAANEDGTLIDPLTAIEVSHELSHQTQLQPDDIQDEILEVPESSMRATDVVLIGMCGLLVITAAMLCVAVFKLSGKKKYRR